MEDLEKRVLKELKYGSKKAYEYVFKTYYTPLCRYAYEILKDDAQAEDVVINLFVTVWEERKNINIHTSFRAYLYRGTYNSCLNIIRRKKTENRYRDFFMQHSDFSKTHDYGSLSYPLSGIVEKEMDQKVTHVVDNLPPRCREIFLMSRVEDLSHQEIADKLGLSVNTVKCQIMNALKAIQEVLKDIIGLFVLLLNI